MRIEGLHIKNFTGLREVNLTEIQYGILLTGDNGVGKSSIFTAIRELFFGRSLDAEGKITGNEALVRQGADAADLRAEVSIGERVLILNMIVTRSGKTAKRAFSIIENKRPAYPTVTGADNLRAAFWADCGVDMAVAEASMAPDKCLASTEISGILAGLLLRDVDLRAEVEALEDFTAIQEYATKAHLADVFDAARLKLLGDCTYAERRDVNRDLKRLKALRESLGSPELPEGKTTADIGRGQAALEKAKAQVDALRAERAASVKVAEVAEHQGDPATQIEIERKEIANIEAERTKQQAAHEKAVEGAQWALGKKGGAEADRVAWNTAVIAGTKMLKDFEAGECPLCGCADPALIDGLLQPARERLQEDGLKVERATTQRDAYQIDYDRAVTLGESRHKAVMSLGNEIIEKQKVIAGLEAVAAQLATLADVRHIAEIDADLAKAEARFENIEYALSQLTDAKKAEDLDAQIGDLTEHVARLERWCNLFYHRQFLNGLLLAHAAPFVEMVNAHLSPDYMIAVQPDGGSVELTLSKADGSMTDLPLARASKGERLLVKFAVADALNPGGIVIIDDTDKLSALRANDLLLQFGDPNPGNLFVAMADHLHGPASERFAGFKDKFLSCFDEADLYWVEDGLATALQAQGATT